MNKNVSFWFGILLILTIFGCSHKEKKETDRKMASLSKGFSIEDADPVILIDKEKINFRIKKLFLKYPPLKGLIEDINLSCLEDEDFPDLKTRDILGRCLNAGTLNEKELSGSSLKLLLDLKWGTTLKTNLGFDILKTSKKQITVHSNLSDLTLNNRFHIRLEDIWLKCQKKYNLHTFKFRDIFKHCFNEAYVIGDQILVEDRDQKTKFFIKLKELSVKTGITTIDLGPTQLTGEKNSTTLFKSRVQCMKDPKTSLFKISDFIENCMRLGFIDISEIVAKENKKGKENLHKIFDLIFKDFKNSRGFDPTKDVKPEDAGIKNFRIKINKNRFELKTEMSLWGIWMSIGLDGEMGWNGKTKTLQIKITDTELPLGINSTWLVMFFIEKYAVSSNLWVEDQKIFIKL